MISVGANLLYGHDWVVGVCICVGGGVPQTLLSSFCSTHMARSCDACIRCWHPRFLRITLPCNYLGIMREPPTLSLHNHNPQPLCLNLDLPSLLLFWLLLSLCFCLTIFPSLISSLCLFVGISPFCPSPSLSRILKVFELFFRNWVGIVGWWSTQKKTRHCHSFLSCVVRSNCQLISLNNVVVCSPWVNNVSISSLISIQLKQAGVNSVLLLMLLGNI